VFSAGFLALLFGWYIWQSVPGYNIEPGFRTVEKAYINQQSGVMAEVSGRVVRVLVDGQTETEQQKFVIRLQNGQNILVGHNIRVSEKVPVEVNDTVTVRGEYTWSEPGGLIQWTSRDPGMKKRHGWVQHRGKIYD
jgi:hypothetical protein